MTDTRIEAMLSKAARKVFAELTTAELVTYGPNTGKAMFKGSATYQTIIKSGKINPELLEIKAALVKIDDERKAAAAEYQRKLDGIEGLTALNKLADEWATYRARTEYAMDNDRTPPKMPETLADLAAKYPRAAAYRKASAWESASNYIKSGCGRRAVKRIVNGDDHDQVINDMEREWSDYTSNAVD